METEKMIVAFRHELHENPELSGCETETKQRLMRFIREHTGLAVCDQGKWVYAYYEPEKKTDARPIAFRADMDALPMPEAIDLPWGSRRQGAAHKCGHDGHSSVLAWLALRLEGDAAIRRPVYLIFQSAEETGRGGRDCAQFIREQGIGEVYAFHNLSGYPEGAVMVRDRLSQCASKGLTVSFEGRRSHASAPEDGISPVPAASQLALFACGKKEWRGMAPSGKTLLCTVIDLLVGTKDFGISPGSGEVSFTLRADFENEMEDMQRQIESEAERLAGQYGLRVRFAEADPFPETVNDPRCAEKVRAAARSLGLTLAPMDRPWRASEDFGWYTKVCPGAIFYIGNGMDWPMPHQPDYDFNDRILKTAADLFCRLAEGKQIN